MSNNYEIKDILSAVDTLLGNKEKEIPELAAQIEKPLLLKNEAKADEIPALPLGVLIAHTQGGIGYIIQQSLQNLLSKKGLERPQA